MNTKLNIKTEFQLHNALILVVFTAVFGLSNLLYLVFITALILLKSNKTEAALFAATIFSDVYLLNYPLSPSKFAKLYFSLDYFIEVRYHNMSMNFCGEFMKQYYKSISYPKAINKSKESKVLNWQ